MRIAAPSLQRDVEQLVDLRLGADVDAGGRILEHVDLRFEMEPAPDHDLLLIAAGQQFDGEARDRWAASPPSRRGGATAAHSRRGASHDGRARPAASGFKKKFSRTDRPGRIDSPTRSAQTRLTPSSIAARGEPMSTAAPSMRISPPVSGSTPNSARLDHLLAGAAQADQADDLAGMDAGVDRPDGAEAAPPRSRAAACPRARPAAGTPGSARVPTMSRIVSSGVVSATTRSPATLPSRSTTMRSAISNTSSSRCET